MMDGFIFEPGVGITGLAILWLILFNLKGISFRLMETVSRNLELIRKPIVYSFWTSLENKRKYLLISKQ